MRILQFKKFIRIHWLLLGLLLIAAAVLLKPESTVTAQLGEQSFFAPQTWAHDLTEEQGWAPEHPRLLADINGDHHLDVVGFGNDGTWVATANGSSFTPVLALGDFGFHAGGWRTNLHVRTAGDVNGDQMDDIVGFGNAGVYRALATGNGALGSADFVVADFGYDQGWRNDKHVRLLADVNGDSRKDIVGFGTHGVWVSLSMSTAGDFSAPFFAVGDFGTLQGWNNEEHVRTTADVNGDTMQDIVGFGDHGVWVSFAAGGGGFQSPQLLLTEFAILAGGWRVDRHPRIMADVNKDTKADIVGFGYDGVWISYSTGTGFTAPQFAIADFGYNQGWRVGKDPVFEADGHAHTGCANSSCGYGSHPRFVVDLNADGYLDVVGFGNDAIYRALGTANGFMTARGMIRDLGTAYGSPWNGYEDVVPTFNPRLAGDVDGDGMTDLVAFDQDVIKVVRSSDQAPPPLPKVPGNPQITGSTATSLSVKWDDLSNDERRFFVYFWPQANTNDSRLIIKAQNSTTAVLNDLEPATEYCFSVHAENLFGISAGTRRVCGNTSKEAPPTPTPTPPPPTGFKQIDVLNCAANGVNLWTLNASNVWTQHGTAPSQLINGSCPSNAPKKTVPLPDNQWVLFVAVDPKLCGGQNDPNMISCQKAKLPVFGKMTGLPLPYLIN
jgi:hypothetical protein